MNRCPHCNALLDVRLHVAGGDQPQKRRPSDRPPQPMTDERAERFEMPFGKFQGMTLAQIAETNEGVEYLKWGATQWDRAVGRAVRHYLESLSRA
jgi:hypothetical protein